MFSKEFNYSSNYYHINTFIWERFVPYEKCALNTYMRNNTHYKTEDILVPLTFSDQYFCILSSCVLSSCILRYSIFMHCSVCCNSHWDLTGTIFVLKHYQKGVRDNLKIINWNLPNPLTMDKQVKS